MSLRFRDTHHGRPSGTLPELVRRPLELLWAEAAETLTWAEMGSLLSTREQDYQSLLWAKIGRERSAPGLNSLGVGRASYAGCLDDGVWFAWEWLGKVGRLGLKTTRLLLNVVAEALYKRRLLRTIQWSRFVWRQRLVLSVLVLRPDWLTRRLAFPMPDGAKEG